MKKTIIKIEKTNYVHPALGFVFRLTFEDRSVEWVYEECFYDLVKGYKSPKQLIGIEADIDELMMFELLVPTETWGQS